MNVTTRLAQEFGDPVKMTLDPGEAKAAKLKATFPNGTFMIKIEGHPLVVRFDAPP
jgi:hypothetical protein